jgi:hypothetical protein
MSAPRALGERRKVEDITEPEIAGVSNPEVAEPLISDLPDQGRVIPVVFGHVPTLPDNEDGVE